MTEIEYANEVIELEIQASDERVSMTLDELNDLLFVAANRGRGKWAVEACSVDVKDPRFLNVLFAKKTMTSSHRVA